MLLNKEVCPVVSYHSSVQLKTQQQPLRAAAVATAAGLAESGGGVFMTAAKKSLL